MKITIFSKTSGESFKISQKELESIYPKGLAKTFSEDSNYVIWAEIGGKIVLLSF